MQRTRLGGGNREVLAEAAAQEAEKYEMLFDDSIEYVKVSTSPRCCHVGTWSFLACVLSSCL